MMQYQVQQSDRHSKGRVGLLTTGHAEVETPAFMPVGSLGPVKGLEPDVMFEEITTPGQEPEGS